MRVLPLALGFLLLVAGSGCGRGAKNAAADKAGGFKLPVETVLASAERVEDRLSAVGSLDADESVRVQSEVDGRVVTVGFDEGAAVKTGDVLFQLDDVKLQAEVQTAEGRFEKARNNLERARKLLDEHTMSPQEFDDAQAEFKGANGALALARKRLADATIRSPLDGYISERLVSAGQYIDKGQTLVTVVDGDPIKISFAVPERYLTKLEIGQKVEITVAALAGKTFVGEVYFVDPQVDASTRTVKIKARVPNAGGELRPGTFANVALVVGARENGVVVPEQAIVPAIDKATVFVVENGAARRREVTLGARMPGRVEIASGVKAGEEVVVAGQQKLQDQMPVAPTPAKS